MDISAFLVFMKPWLWMSALRMSVTGQIPRKRWLEGLQWEAHTRQKEQQRSRKKKANLEGEQGNNSVQFLYMYLVLWPDWTVILLFRRHSIYFPYFPHLFDQNLFHVKNHAQISLFLCSIFWFPGRFVTLIISLKLSTFLLSHSLSFHRNFLCFSHFSSCVIDGFYE